jgi:anthrone oxygenase-like protein
VHILRETAQFLATLCCSLFSGAAIYVNLVEHPARMACGTEIAAAEFPPSYRRASVMQASLSVFGSLCAVVAWVTGGSALWLVGGVVLGSVVPYTLIAIMPTNKQLLDSSLDRRAQRTHQLLSRWANLHAVRSILSLLALIIFLCLLVASR